MGDDPFHCGLDVDDLEGDMAVAERVGDPEMLVERFVLGEDLNGRAPPPCPGSLRCMPRIWGTL
jgi:hypothetical protein